MPTSPMLDKGPCEIIWGYGETGAAYLGKTLGDVKLTMKTNSSDINEDQAGDAAVNAVQTGSLMELVVPLTRLSVDELADVLGVSESGCVIPLVNQVGCDLYALAKRLVIKPLCGNAISAIPCQWIELYKTYPIAGLDLTWNKDTQRIFPVTFKVFVSQESGYEGLFGTIGMDSASTEFGI